MNTYRVPDRRHIKPASAVYRRLSHELRTPLHAIVGSAEMLVDENRPEQREALVQAIHQAVDAILALEQQLMRTARRAEATDVSREAPPRGRPMPAWTRASFHSSSAA